MKRIAGSRIAPPDSGRYDHIHGDEDQLADKRELSEDYAYESAEQDRMDEEAQLP